MMYLLWRLWYKIRICWPGGHSWIKIGDTLGGDEIMCIVCHTKEEWLPGVHEPRGSYHRNA